MTMGQKLKEVRIKANLTQKEMADLLNLNIRTYGSYERNERKVGTSLVLLICKNLHISSDELLNDIDNIEILETPKSDNITEKEIAPTDDGESEKTKKIKEIIEKASQLGDSDIVQLDNFVSFLIAQTEGGAEE